MPSKISCFPPAIPVPILVALLAFSAVTAPGGGPAAAAEGNSFRRGDVTADGEVSLDDAVFLITHLFLEGTAPPCLDAADADDSGDLALTDPILLLLYLYLGGSPPAAPFPACGADPTNDALGCADYPPCAPLIDPSRLHEIDITVSPADLIVLQTPPKPEWPATPEPWISSTFRFGEDILERVAIRRKGNSTLYYAQGKYSLSVKFDKFIKGRRLRGVEKIILNNCIMDPTFLNEEIGYGIYRRMGLPAPRTAHARVSLNGKSQGIYLLLEAIDEDFLEKIFGEGNGDGNLYEGPGDFLPRDPEFPDEIKEPELKDEDQGRTRDDFRELRAALTAATPSTFLAVAEARFDLKGFIDGWAVDSCTLHFDGYPGNYYLYHEPVRNRFVFMPHGMDQLFGFRDWAEYDPVSGFPIGVPRINYQPEADPFNIPKGGGLVVRLSELPEASRRYREAVREAARVGWDLPAMFAEIDRLAALLAPLRGTPGAAGADAALFEKSVGDLRSFLTRRKAYLERIK